MTSAHIGTSWGQKVLILDIDLGAGQIQARVQDFTVSDPSYLVDAEVRVRGVCGTNFNERRQLVGLRLFVASMNEIAIEKSPPDAFLQPAQPLDGIRRFGTYQTFKHRIRVTGTVTYQRPGALYLQDGDQSMYVETTQPAPIAPGTRIDAVGFPASGPYAPKLQAAVVRVIGSVSQPVPRVLSPGSVIHTNDDGFLTSDYDGLLVRMRAILVDRIPGPRDTVLAMSAGHLQFRAFIPRTTDSDVLARLRTGSELDLTGVVSVLADPSGEPRVFVQLLRSPADVTLVHAATWWDREHALDLLLLVTLAALASFAAVVLLRRRVRHQVEVIRHSYQASEIALKALSEKQLALTEANKELEAFSYTAAHDLRAPLRHIHGFVHLLRQGGYDKLDEEGRRCLDKISTASRDMGVLLDDLLSFSRLSRTELRPEPVSLSQLVEQVRQELEPDVEGRDLTWNVAALPELEADPSLLRQALFNLLANAAKYTRDRKGAQIEVGSTNSSDANEVTVFVRDNGAGFETEYVDKLFRVFQRLHSANEFEGTGIGLAIVRRIVERHGGRVWADGAPGQGATFYISLPIGRENRHGEVRLHSAGR